jgi:predicted 3-demethylubiquinone-9 3-methyltransferase (glyoxalase superfamily)
MPEIMPFLWFDGQAEEAANFYASVFHDAKIIKINKKDGKALTVTFELLGRRFIGLNGGPTFKFNEAVSFFVTCETQAEVDEYWEKLSAGGQEVQCGWLKDKYGLFWQIVPSMLMRLLGDPDPQKAKAAFDTMLTMKKIVIADIEKAVEGRAA